MDLEDDIFQALCQLEYLRDHVEDGGTIQRVRNDLVEIDLPDNSYTEVNLRPIQRLLDGLRAMRT